LESGLGGVTPKNNQGIWWEHQGEVKSLLRKGDVLGGGTITSFSVFTPPSHVVGQTRSFNTHADLALKATFSDRTQGIFVLSSGTACVQIAVSGGAAPSISGQPARFGVFGSPILNEQGNTAFLATLSGTARGSLFSTAILAETGSSHELKIVARTGLPAPDANGLTGTIGAFSSFCEPVFNANDQVAFLGKLDLGKGVNAANQWGIWASHLGSLALVVQSQMQAPGCPKGAKFRSFDQIVMGDSGVIFTANLTGASAGIKPSNDQGIWAVDAGGNLRLMARKGDVMRDGSFKVLSGISLFKPSGETSGQTRNFNSARDLIYQVTFTDKTQAIQKVVIP